MIKSKYSYWYAEKIYMLVARSSWIGGKNGKNEFRFFYLYYKEKKSRIMILFC